MKSLNQLSKTVMALSGAVIMMGTMSQAANAFNFQQEDLILSLYGNSKEVLVNLSDLTPVGGSGPVGTMDQISGSSTIYNYDLSAYLNTTGVLGAETVRYTVMGFKQDENTFETAYRAGSSSTAATVGVQTSSIGYVTALDTFRGNVSDVNTPNVNGTTNIAIVNRLGDFSHTGRMGIADTLGDGFNMAMASNLDQILNVVNGDPFASGSPVTAMGQALLSGNGLFQITGGQLAAVPVPAAIILFGTGIIGLVGIARRKLFGQVGQA